MENEMQLWKHQQRGVEEAIKRKHYAFFYEAGTGKSRTTLEVLKYHYEKLGEIKNTLILCPVIVVNNWVEEIAKFTNIHHRNVAALTGSTKRRINIMESTRAKILITNYEGLVGSGDFFRALQKFKPMFLVCDESHKCKSYNSKRTKLTTMLADEAEYKYLLSGTPILNSPMDVFSQYLILDGGQTFGRNYFGFRNMYFYDKNINMPKQKHFPNWQIRPSAAEEISEKIYAKAMQAKKSECLDLPPLIKKIIKVELSPEQRKIYDEMKNHLITFMGEEAVTAEMALTKALRLMQILTGFVKTTNGENISFKTNPRRDALKELLEEIAFSNKVIVWCVFKENYLQVKQVCDELGLQFVEVHGDISDKHKVEAIHGFNNDPDKRVFIGHPGSGGIGVNLTAASYMIYFSRNFSLEQDIQSEARNYRGGSEIHESIVRIDLVAADTIDEHVCTALSNKVQIKDQILDWRDKL